jgi:leader peptidase (prepilin peptidase) / N-methyltransferase
VDLIYALEASPSFLVGCSLVLGLVVGSFLNVVILRLPRRMEQQWQRDCAETLNQPVSTEEPLVSLVYPSSHCPSCHAAIKRRHNIPLIGWLWLRGRCASCKTWISIQYPLVELLTGLASAALAWQLGPSLALAAALPMTWALIALAGIDLRHQLLPDVITLPLLWAGLLLSLTGTFTDPRSSIIGAAAGYLSLWSVFQVFRLLTGKEGMGYGDFKLLAVFGAWLGWQMLPMIILLASLTGTLVGVALILSRRLQQGVPIAFGPYLAVAGWIALLAGDEINRRYLQLSGLL